MKNSTYLFIISLLFISCKNSNYNNSGLIATIGQQPSIASSNDGEVMIVFGNEESIYYSSSKNQGESFSDPSLVANHPGLVLGYSSGPSIAITPKSIVVTAPDKIGNLYAWSRPVDIESWSGPFRINDIDKSVGEFLSDITSTPDGRMYCVWIDTRIIDQDNHEEHSGENHKKPAVESAPKTKVDLNQMTPLGISMGELFERIGGIPENAVLNFHDDNDGKLYWVLLDKDKNVLKAESLEEYAKFRKRNENRIKTEGKIYLASSFDGGKTWTKSKMVYSSPDGSVCECCKPSIVSDNDGNLTIMFRNNIDGSRDLHFTKSENGGETFSIPEKLGSGTWKINGCPMDGGDLTVDKNRKLMTVWKREGDVFMSNSSDWEEKISSGRTPSISSNDKNTYVGFSQGEDIISFTTKSSVTNKIGIGSSPKVLALENGAIYFWVNSEGIKYKKVI